MARRPDRVGSERNDLARGNYFRRHGRAGDEESSLFGLICATRGKTVGFEWITAQRSVSVSAAVSEVRHSMVRFNEARAFCPAPRRSANTAVARASLVYSTSEEIPPALRLAFVSALKVDRHAPSVGNLRVLVFAILSGPFARAAVSAKLN